MYRGNLAAKSDDPQRPRFASLTPVKIAAEKRADGDREWERCPPAPVASLPVRVPRFLPGVFLLECCLLPRTLETKQVTFRTTINCSSYRASPTPGLLVFPSPPDCWLLLLPPSPGSPIFSPPFFRPPRSVVLRPLRLPGSGGPRSRTFTVFFYLYSFFLTLCL